MPTFRCDWCNSLVLHNGLPVELTECQWCGRKYLCIFWFYFGWHPLGKRRVR